MKPLHLVMMSATCGVQTWAAIPFYDTLNRLARIENTDGSGIQYTYDSSGNLTNRIPYLSPEVIVTVDPPSGGFVTGAHKAPHGTQLPLIATPAGGFTFVAWLLPDGSVFSTNPSISYTLTKTETLTAKFAPVEGPAIVEHPEGGQFVSGSTVTLSVSATGKDPLAYSWTHNGQPVSGVSSPTYSFPNATFLNAGTYAAEVSDSGGTTRSRDALITIPLPSYNVWKSTVFTSQELTANDPAIVGQNAIVSPDGASNLMHFAFGSRSRFVLPETPFRISNAADSPLSGIFEYNRLIGGGGLGYKVLISDNLQNWDETQSRIEPAYAPFPNPDGITQRVGVRLKEPERTNQRKAFFKLNVAQAVFALSAIDDYNYFDSGSVSGSAPEIRSEVPMGGRFEAVPGGIQAKAGRTHGGGTLITKQTFIPDGKVAEYLWSGSGGTLFMQVVWGAITEQWITSPGNIELSAPVCTFNGTYEGSWVAKEGVIYKTSITFTSNTATFITVDSISGVEYGRGKINSADFSRPMRLYIRGGDTHDNAKAFVLLKSLTVKPAQYP